MGICSGCSSSSGGAAELLWMRERQLRLRLCMRQQRLQEAEKEQWRWYHLKPCSPPTGADHRNITEIVPALL